MRKLSAVVMAALMVVGALPLLAGASSDGGPSSRVNGDNEPNDTWAQAEQLTGSPTINNGAVGKAPDASDWDFYYLDLTYTAAGETGDNIQVSITAQNHGNGQSTLSAYAFAPDQTIIAADLFNLGRTNQAFEWTAVVTGRYWIAIVQGHDLGTTYTLQVTRTNGAALTTNGNNDAGNATPIARGVGDFGTYSGSGDLSALAGGDPLDYFSIDAVADTSTWDMVIVKINVPGGGLNVKVDLFDNNMIYPPIDDTSCGGACAQRPRLHEEPITWSIMTDAFHATYFAWPRINHPAGDHFLRFWARANAGPYTFEVTWRTIDNDTNDNEIDATPLNIVDHHAVGSGNVAWQLDERDYFIFDAYTGTEVNVTVTNLDFDATYNIPRMTAGVSDPFNSFIQTAFENPEPDGYYYGHASTGTAESPTPHSVVVEYGGSTGAGTAYDLDIFVNTPVIVTAGDGAIQLSEGTANSDIMLRDWFDDADDGFDSLLFDTELTGDLAGLVTVNVGSSGDHVVTFTAPIDVTGTGLFRVNVTDPWGATGFKEFAITVYGINDPPMLNTSFVGLTPDHHLPTLYLSNPEEEEFVLDLTGLFIDPNGDKLNFDANASSLLGTSKDQVMTGGRVVTRWVDLNGHMRVTFDLEPNLVDDTGWISVKSLNGWNGTETITFSAWDNGVPNYPTPSDDEVTMDIVIPSGEKFTPVFDTTNPTTVSFDEDDLNGTSFGLTVIDQDGQLSDLVWTLSGYNTSALEVTKVTATSPANITVTPKVENWHGTENVRFLVRDVDAQSALWTVAVVVNSIPDKPLLDVTDPQLPQAAVAEGQTKTFSIRVVDVDTPPSQLHYVWSLDGEVLTSEVLDQYEMSPGYDTLTAAQKTKTRELSVVVSDPDSNAPVTFGWTIGISNTNRAPTVPKITAPAPNTHYIVGTPVSFTAGNSTDPDGDAVNYKWTDNGAALGVGESVTAPALLVGSHDIVVIASDGEASSKTNITVLITEKPKKHSNPTPGFEGVGLLAVLALVAVVQQRIRRRT